MPTMAQQEVRTIKQYYHQWLTQHMKLGIGDCIAGIIGATGVSGGALSAYTADSVC